jgi:hypothetical protein
MIMTDEQHMALGEPAYKAAPREQRHLDERLMTAERLVDLAKRRGVRVQRDERGVVVVCADCQGQVMALVPAPHRGRKRIEEMTNAEMLQAAAERDTWGPSYAVDLGQLLADTVRHGVMHHDDVLSGAQEGASSERVA